MSGEGAPDQKPIDCHELRVAVVASSWHEKVMSGLLDGADRALRAYKVEAPVVVRVPGAFELPVVAAALAAQGYDAVVALGVEPLLELFHANGPSGMRRRIAADFENPEWAYRHVRSASDTFPLCSRGTRAWH